MNENYENFRNDLLLEAEISGVLQAEAFFQIYASAAIENGDIEHVEPQTKDMRIQKNMRIQISR